MSVQVVITKQQIKRRRPIIRSERASLLGQQSFGKMGRMHLDIDVQPIWGLIERALHGLDVAFGTAILFSMIIIHLVTTSSGYLVSLSYRPINLELPWNVITPTALQQFLDPPNEYAVIGASTTIDPAQFQGFQLTEYLLQPGDTLLGLALRFGLNMDTIASFNGIEDVRRMRSGISYQIPDRDGLLYTVKQGDSLSSIATTYEVDSDAILDSNNLISSSIPIGTVLFVPGARMDPVELKLILGELMVYPYRGRLTSGFGMRNDPFTGIRRFHNGIDIGGSVGSAIRTAMPGIVSHIGSQPFSYGKFVIVRHTNGFQTLYAHLDSHRVSVGQYIGQGEIIGRLGNTGRSTGPHLHFAVIKNGAFVNPFRYIH